MSREDFEKRRRQRIQEEYEELRGIDPDLYREVVQSADGILMNNHRALAALDNAARVKLGADIEEALVHYTLRGLHHG